MILSEDNIPKIIDLISKGIINSDEVLKKLDSFIPGIEDLYNNPDALGYLGKLNIKQKNSCNKKL